MREFARVDSKNLRLRARRDVATGLVGPEGDALGERCDHVLISEHQPLVELAGDAPVGSEGHEGRPAPRQDGGDLGAIEALPRPIRCQAWRLRRKVTATLRTN